MSASRVADGSVLRTGLSHVALGLVTFGTLGAGAFGAAMLFGSEEAGGPRVELALYSEQNGPPPPLKNRLALESLDAHGAATPDLGIEYSDLEDSLGADGNPLTITVTEISSNAGPAAIGLPRAPISGFCRRSAPTAAPRRRPMPAPSPAFRARPRSPSSSAASA